MCTPGLGREGCRSAGRCTCNINYSNYGNYSNCGNYAKYHVTLQIKQKIPVYCTTWGQQEF